MIRSATRSTLTNKVNYRSMLAGNDPFSLGDFDLLETTTLASSASSVTFSGLGSYTDYKHLQIRMIARTDRSTNGDAFDMRINNDSGSNYTYHFLQGDGTSVSSSGTGSQNRILLLRIASNGDVANSFGGGVIDILDTLDTSKNTTVRALAGSSASFQQLALNSGLYTSTNAVNEINFFPSSGNNFVTGSRFSLYGIRG